MQNGINSAQANRSDVIIFIYLDIVVTFPIYQIMFVYQIKMAMDNVRNVLAFYCYTHK